MRVIRTDPADVFGRLVLDERCLRDPLRRSYFLADASTGLRASRWVVVGLSGREHELVHVERARADGVRMLRRFTGGGTVALDEHAVLVTLCCDADRVGVQPYPREIMRWTEEKVFGPAFRACGAAKFAGRENDYVVDGRKVGGNAQAIAQARFVHHTSFLWRVAPETMSYLKMPSKKPEYRGEREHMDFLQGLESILTCGKEDFTQAIQRAFASALGGSDVVQDDDDLPPPLTRDPRSVPID
jgi:lipoate-protein ligase A